MIVVDTVAGLRKELDAARAEGRAVGFVPTMGFLHAGHGSLFARARTENDVVAASIFVNPLQFAPTEDLAAYPRDLERDTALAAAEGVDVLFVPPVEEMEPAGGTVTRVRVDVVSGDMEGAARPTHFEGVATVVARLFNIVGPCRAYFGEKDFQQLAVIRRMVADLRFPVDVVGCDTVREPDGLAMSSRNVYLSAEERVAATVLHRALLAGRAAVEGGERDPAAVRRLMSDVVAAEALASLDYAEAVDAASLQVPDRLTGDVRLLVAARVGPARLIDNVGVHA